MRSHYPKRFPRILDRALRPVQIIYTEIRNKNLRLRDVWDLGWLWQWYGFGKLWNKRHGYDKWLKENTGLLLKKDK